METLNLNIDVFVQEVLKEIHLENDTEMEELLRKEVDRVVNQAISMNMEPILVDYLAHRFPNETDPYFLALQAIGNSSKIQVAILNGLEELKAKMIESMHSPTRTA